MEEEGQKEVETVTKSPKSGVTIAKKVANIPLLSDLAKGIGKIIDSIKSVLRWIAKLKRELHLAAQDQEDLVKNGRDKNGNIIRKERHPKKVEEKKQIKDMTLPELE